MELQKFITAGVGFTLMLSLPISAAAQGKSPSHGTAVRSDVSPAWRDIKQRRPVPQPNRTVKNKIPIDQAARHRGNAARRDPLRQTAKRPSATAAATPAPGQSFEGVSDDDNAAVIGGRIVPPDTQGDVGPNHYVQWVNLAIEVFNKSGTSVFGPVAGNSIWNGFGGICDNNNDGDPIVLYDHLADRWVISQFAIGSTGHQCVAVSTTPDPTGTYHRYDFEISPAANGFNDYPKMGIWPDGYYLSANEFQGSFVGAIAVAFERDKMLNGQTAQFVKFGPLPCGTTCFFALQPAHLEGPAPAAGTPNTFVMAFDDETWGPGNNSDTYRLWEFDVNFANPGSSTFNSLPSITTAEFDANMCNFSACVPQPGGRNRGERLDTLSQFTMYRAQYRSFSGHDSIVLNHTVDADGNNTGGIRWVELRNSGGGWSLHQSGTYAPNDGENRWMGSAAMDSAGNIALGYSVSSGGTFPSIRYTSRVASDPLGQMPGGEVELIAGAGAQQNSYNRWGDYSSMSVDPSDGCTFWFTSEYYANNGSFDFKTRIGSFKLPECPGGGGCTPNENPEVSCADGVDNDCDGDIDSADSDCAPPEPVCGDGSCNGTEDICSCPADCGAAPSSESACFDGVDNDCDTLVDCADTDCTGGNETSCSDGTDNDCDTQVDCSDSDCQVGSESNCDDGVDNDCDGLVDCDDSLDCAADSACAVCTLGQKGDSCTSNSDCCSNKCKGRSGNKSCK
jgi:hypothetical protein